MESCAFCRIVAGEADAHRVYESERVVAFLDANPAVRGHTLVVPVAHGDDVFANDADAGAVFEAVRTLADALERALDVDGVSVFYTTPRIVGGVDHPHVHLLPRDSADGVHLSLPRGSLDDGEATALTARVREGL
ncbi:HIT family protein [Halarchaeum sp. P4]|uniref:HIT family protein n=1 Tax=Halarchaeum sp. P4 TaxID=3421639 RepID=UPI003EBF74F4